MKNEKNKKSKKIQELIAEIRCGLECDILESKGSKIRDYIKPPFNHFSTRHLSKYIDSINKSSVEFLSLIDQMEADARNGSEELKKILGNIDFHRVAVDLKAGNISKKFGVQIDRLEQNLKTINDFLNNVSVLNKKVLGLKKNLISTFSGRLELRDIERALDYQDN